MCMKGKGMNEVEDDGDGMIAACERLKKKTFTLSKILVSVLLGKVYRGFAAIFNKAIKSIKTHK